MSLDQKITILIENLEKAGLHISTAESCTGGGIAAAITAVAGSSAVFNGSVVAYSNRVKAEVLQVDLKTLEHFGAVSEEVVAEMAVGVAKLMDTEVAIATSGIAGPAGGTPNKPVGLVCFAIYFKGKVDTTSVQFSGNRKTVQKESITFSIDELNRYIKDK